MTSTGFELTPEQKERAMQGHFIDGSAMPHVPTGRVVVGSSGLYTTANDMLAWFTWHMNQNDQVGAETRLIDHATDLRRDAMDVVFGMNEPGFMDGMALGWVVMDAEESRRMILQKAGGMQGMLVYLTFAPAHNIGVYVAINEYDFNAGPAVNIAANELIGMLTAQ
ncbi:MAG: serine hydrolase [Alphaproteobacteria bacterium]|jgi:serine-type D-Ala-D-Ala carboxypeptidase/endopeptidase|nr:serine hydrolase [Alphaproteobacteria bacterium]